MQTELLLSLAAAMRPPVAMAVAPSQWSARHGVGLDGAAATDEDSMAKAMRRKAETNLDFSGTVKSSKSFLTFPTSLMDFKLHNVGLSLGTSVSSISVSTNTLKRMDFYKLKFTPTVLSKSYTYLSDDDGEEEEVYAVSYGRLLSHLVGEVSEVGLWMIALWARVLNYKQLSVNLDFPPLNVMHGLIKTPR
jgi:hypothetical protein